MKRLKKAVAALATILMLSASMTLSMGQAAQAANDKGASNPSGLEPVVTAKTVNTDFNTPISFTPEVSSVGLGLEFCIVEAPGNCDKSGSTDAAGKGKGNNGQAAKIFSVKGEGTWAVNPLNGEVTFTPEASFSGATKKYTYRAADAYGAGDANIQVVVAAPAAPTVSATLATTPFNTEINVVPVVTGAIIVDSSACLVAVNTCLKSMTVFEEGTWTVEDDRSVTFVPDANFAGTTRTMQYRIADSAGQATSGPIVIAVGNPAEPLANSQTLETDFDTNISFIPDVVSGTNIVKGKTCIVKADGSCVKRYTVDGEGSWSVAPDGTVTFDPESTFAGTTSTVAVRISDSYRATGGKCKDVLTCTSQTADSAVRVKVAAPTTSISTGSYIADTEYNTTITFSPELDGTVAGSKVESCLFDPADGVCKSVVRIADKGTWSVKKNNGSISFDPAAHFAGKTEPIAYSAVDQYGRSASGTIKVRVKQPQNGGLNNNFASTTVDNEVIFTPRATSGHKVDYSTACLVDPATDICGETVEVAGQGTWTIYSDGQVKFSPAAGFVGTPSSIEYQVTGSFGPKGLCENSGKNAKGRFDNGEVSDENGTQGTHVCHSTQSGRIGVHVKTPGSPKVHAKRVSTAFNTPIVFLPKVTGRYLDYTSACLVNPLDLTCNKTLEIPTRGTFEIYGTDGQVKFTPLSTFAGRTPRVYYRVANVYGEYDQNLLSVTVDHPYYPTLGETWKTTLFNTPITFMPDVQGWNLQYSSACLVDPADSLCKQTVVLEGYGTFTVNNTNGEVTFTPVGDYLGTVPPVDYRIVDGYGWTGDNCWGGNSGKCDDTNDLCNHLDHGDHNAQYGDDCNRDIHGMHDNDLNNGNNGGSGDRDGCEAGFDSGPNQTREDEGDFESDHEDGGYHECKGLYTNTLHIFIAEAGAPTVDPAKGVTPWNTPITLHPQVHTIDGTTIDPTRACLVDPVDGNCKKTVAMTGKGVWTVNPDGTVTFTPYDYFAGTTPKIEYHGYDNLGKYGVGPLEVTVLDPSHSTGGSTHKVTDFETPITFTPTVSGTNLLWYTACLIDPADGVCKKEVTYAGQGTFVVDAVTGEITFTPAAGFVGTTTSIVYQLVDAFGWESPNCSKSNQSTHCRGVNSCLAKDPMVFLNSTDSTGTYDDEDGQGTSSCFYRVTNTVTVTVNPPANPRVTDISTTTPLNTSATVYPQVDGVDIQPLLACLVVGDTCVKTLTEAGVGTWTVNDDGSVTFDPATDYIGPVSPVTYRATDGFGRTGTGTIRISVRDSLAPTMDNLDTTTPFDTNKTIDVSTLVHGTGLDVTKYCIVTNEGCVKSYYVYGQGLWTVDTFGDVTFDPDYGFTGKSSAITLRVEDTRGRTGTGKLTVTVAKPTAPAVQDIDDTTAYNTPWSGTPEATGTQLLPASACFKTNTGCVDTLEVPGEGTWTVDDNGKVTFTPVDGFAGKTTYVVYQISDAYEQTGTGTIQVTVEKPAPPTVGDVNDNTNYMTDWVGTPGDAGQPVVTGTNIDYTTVCLIDPADSECRKSVTIAGQGTWTVNSTTGVVTFSPASKFVGVATALTFRIADAYGQEATGTITITVNKPDAPKVTDDLESTTPYDTNKDVTPLVEGTDVDPSTACFKTADDCVKELDVPGEGKWTVDEEGKITFNPDPEFTGPTTPVDYCVSDEFGSQGCGKVKITVLDPEAPVVLDKKASTDYETPWKGTPTVKGTSLDWTSACIVVEGDCVKELDIPGQGKFEIDPTTGEITFTPVDEFSGDVDPITYRMCDDFDNCDEGTLELTVKTPADPIVTGLTDTTPWDTNKTVTPEVKGPKIDPTKACLLDGEGGCVTTLIIEDEGTWTVNSDGSVTFNPLRGFFGKTSTVTYQATNEWGQTGTGSIAITVGQPAAPSLASPSSKTIAYNTSTTLQPVATAGSGEISSYCIVTADGCELTLTTGQGTWSISPTTGLVTFDAAEGFAGDAGPITVKVIDEFDKSATAPVSLVVDKPAPPVIAPEENTTAFDTPITFTPFLVSGVEVSKATACVIDPDDNICKTDVTTAAGRWQVNTTSGAVTFTPTPGFVGQAAITYQLTDKFGQNGSAVVKVNVSSSPYAALNGVVWLDLNKDGDQDTNEPGIPGVTVTANGLTVSTSIRISQSTLWRASTGRGTVVVKNAQQATATTDKNGFYSFQVAPGKYEIKALLNTSSIYQSWNTGNTSDWIVTVQAQMDQVNQADFAAAGNGAMGGTAKFTDGTKIPLADVVCTWSGLDGILGNDDDMEVVGVADANGNFSFEGLPGGKFDCVGEDPQTSRASAKVPVTVVPNGPAAVVALKVSKVRKYSFTVSGFKPGSPVLTRVMVARIKAELAKHPVAKRVTIKGFTMGPTILKVDKKLSEDRAKAAWARVKTLNNIAKLVKYSGTQDYKRIGSKIRRVYITLYFY